MKRSPGRRRAQPRAHAATLALLPPVSARARHSFAAEYDLEAIGASHGG